MKILVIDCMSADATKEKILPHRLDEARKVLGHFLSGKLREIYSRQDHAGVVQILECDNLDEAKALMDEMPLKQHGFVEFEYIPLGPY